MSPVPGAMVMPETSGTRRELSLTKIVATLGPATDDPEDLARLVKNGASVFRLNFSHGNFDDHAKRLAMVREVGRESKRMLAVMGDLSGPKIRVGRVEGEGIMLRAGQVIVFRNDIDVAQDGESPAFPCTYAPIVDEVEVGHRVLINDGAVRTLAEERGDGELRCRVTVGGLVTTGKGVNLPDSEISAPAITEKDKACTKWAVEHGLDYLAFSFVRRGEEVAGLKRLIVECGAVTAEGRHGIPVFAKIEKPQAVERIEEILREADGIMVARGDLGVEMDLARVPVTQKMLIAKARVMGKPCIVATQMLETMIENATPTRAEASDVANAIFDRTDAVMLSGETAVGKHGARAVDMMRRIALATEERLGEMARYASTPTETRASRDRVAALAHGTWEIAEDFGATFVGVWSEAGHTARYLSRIGLHVPILAFSSDEAALRRSALLYGVIPVHSPRIPEHRSDFDQIVDVHILESGIGKAGDPIVLLGGKPFGTPGATNTVSVRKVGEVY